MIFKVDFEKAFDSVRWDYLDDILNKFGFGVKWRGWIQGCLNSAMVSILVNGSPTSEFKFHKDNSLTLSHLFYSNDAVFVGKWDKSNRITIVNVLKCFFLASGLKINLHKSKLMGIGIPQDDVNMAANFIGCNILTTPFNYLGVKVVGIMSRSSSWEDVLAKISSRLTKWKLKTFSIGGRLTLIESVLSYMSLYQMSIYKVLMGVLNRMNPHAIYGDRGALDNPGILSRRSPWINIIREFDTLSQKGIDIHSHVKKKVGNGEHTAFWDDVWLTESPLKYIYPSLFALECAKHASIAGKFRDSSLIASFRRAPRRGIEEEQLHLLADRAATVICQVSMTDGFGRLSPQVYTWLGRLALILTISYCQRWVSPLDG
ncbi:RNA-directed DNA polymerase, eukaryota [Tanacetum coccineum]|uniref:RNA-directed DNA polymerase, eukaryota n=1 Tax=Tanacetum coccineum TaxID=301880 RepID=A0ABQ5F4A6_9ASTR